MFLQHAGRLGAGVSLADAGLAVVAVIGIATAHADDTTVDVNGWTVTLNGSDTSSNAVLADPSDSLGLGSSPIAGTWTSNPSGFFSSGSDDTFSSTAPATDNSLSGHSLTIGNIWLPHGSVFPEIDEEQVDIGNVFNTYGFLVPAIGGKEVVDLLNLKSGSDSPPLVNPDATGPVNMGGLPMASPQDGGLLNDLFDAVLKGDTADWGKAVTLFGDLLGFDLSGVTTVVDPSAMLPA